MPVRLYVGNLPKENIERQALQDMFAEAGEIMSTKVIKDRKTGKCRGFAFVTVATDEMADEFIEKYNGQSFMENPLKIEKALPRSKGKSSDSEDDSSSNSSHSSSTKSSSKKSGKKRGNRSQSSSQSSSNNESFQPDPRWADELTKLKEMLAASSNN